MKNQLILQLILPVALLFGLAACNAGTDAPPAAHDAHAHHQPAAAEAGAKKSLSPRTAAMADIGDMHVHIDYSSPSVRGRVIWGGLVAYDQVWVTGAHKATSIEFSRPVRIGGQMMPAGKYALFTIPGKEEWVVIINTNHTQHLADEYDTDDDVVRLRVIPETMETPAESLTFDIAETAPHTGTVTLRWEKVKITFPFEAIQKLAQ